MSNKDPKDPKSPEVSVASMVLSDMAAKGEISGHKKKMSCCSGDPYGTSLKKGEETLEKSMLNVLNGPANQIERLAFEVNPYASTEFSGLYRRKSRLLPDYLLKRISIQDNLVASILLARSNQMSAFGRPQPSRDTTGFRIEVSPSHASNLSEEEKKILRDRIAEVESVFLTCGETRNEKEFMFVQARNAITFGRIATEVVYDYSAKGKRFHTFRAIDAGTIYMANKLSDSQVRLEAAKRIKKLRRERAGIGISPEAVQNNEYSWYQVIDDTPLIAFRDDECLVHNFYPCTDVELAGYPVTPIDTVISAITTHLNIVAHNKLYFQSGRAARGMLVIQSDDIDEESIANIKQHFNANINSVTNAWRVPVFKVDREDSVSWQTIDMSGRDMEFQYLSDSNAREILSAFQMSPEEIPGYAHLSRGTNSQSLSESSSEYQLEAHRDLGIRPLLGQMQNFINSRLFPIIAPDLAKIASFKFLGLDAETPEKESIRLQQDLAVHMTMDEVLERVEKDPVGLEYGGNFLLNPQWQAQLDKYVFVGEIMEHFFQKKGAAQDPRFQYMRDPFFFQWQQLAMQQQQMQQAQQQQEQMAAQQAQQPQGNELEAAAQNAHQGLEKNESQMSLKQRALIKQQEKIVQHALDNFKKESEEAVGDILSSVAQHFDTE